MSWLSLILSSWSFHLFLPNTKFLLLTFFFLILESQTNGLYWVIHSSLFTRRKFYLISSNQTIYMCSWWTRLICDQVSFLFLKELIFQCHVHGCRKLQIYFLLLITDSKIITFMLVLICPLTQVPTSLLVLNTS